MLTVLAMPCHCQGPSHLVVILKGETGFQGPRGNDRNIFGCDNWRKKYTSSNKRNLMKNRFYLWFTI